MQTELLCPTRDDTALARAATLLRAGEVVGIPTETVYGLGANALDETAVRKIFAAKGRPQDNPLIVHIAHLQDMPALCMDIPTAAYQLAEAFWPGPLTIILPKSTRIPYVTSGGLDTVGLRLPSHPMAREIIRLAQVPIAAPSANLSGRPSTTTAQHVLDDLAGKIPAVVEGGACTVGVESTVITLALPTPRLLRPGGITLEQLQEVLGTVDVDRALHEKISDDTRVSAPGMKYRHYAPRAPVIVVRGNPADTAQYIRTQTDCDTGILCFDECAPLFEQNSFVRTFGAAEDVHAQANQIFDRLREFDTLPVQRIFAQCPPENGLGLAVSNRIAKAAGFSIVTLTHKEGAK